jgi:hypothetical protein
MIKLMNNHLVLLEQSKPERPLSDELLVLQWERECCATLDAIINRASEPEKTRILRRIRAICSGHIMTEKKSAASSARMREINANRRLKGNQNRQHVTAHADNICSLITSALKEEMLPIAYCDNEYDTHYAIVEIVERRNNTLNCLRYSRRDKTQVVNSIIDLRKIQRVEVIKRESYQLADLSRPT